jgi:hypothetical protein
MCRFGHAFNTSNKKSGEEMPEKTFFRLTRVGFQTQTLLVGDSVISVTQFHCRITQMFKKIVHL